MSTFSLISAIALPFLTAAIGYLLGVRRDATKLNKEKRTEAYLDFLKKNSLFSREIVGQVIAKMLKGEDLLLEEKRLLESMDSEFSDLHGRLLIYGSPGFLKKLVDFYDGYPGGWQTPGGEDAYAALVAEMRKDSVSEAYKGYDEHVKSLHLSGIEKRRDRLRSLGENRRS
ncbi:hypothetical protein WJT74_00270 [Sphingomicrobium sp. XHP0239]|uniref:hypothetical protein n=1 Tax=Sphingomicrobium maritimum TaxID=3133972 RepID=UPI0031CC72FB